MNNTLLNDVLTSYLILGPKSNQYAPARVCG